MLRKMKLLPSKCLQEQKVFTMYVQFFYIFHFINAEMQRQNLQVNLNLAKKFMV